MKFTILPIILVALALTFCAPKNNEHSHGDDGGLHDCESVRCCATAHLRTKTKELPQLSVLALSRG